MRPSFVALIGLLVVLLSGCGPSREQQAQQAALKESLVRLQTAMAQGVSFSEYTPLVLDARTKLTIGRSALSPAQAADAETAVSDAEAVNDIWNKNFIDICLEDCSAAIRSDLLRLGLIKKASEYKAYLASHGISDPDDNPTFNNSTTLMLLVREGMSNASDVLSVAIKAIE